jgi:ketosteroid isomerase-like protein
MNGSTIEWDIDFPPVMRFIDLQNTSAKPWKILDAHPDYDAAKNHEDRAAAVRLIHDFLKLEQNQEQLKILRQKYPDAIVVPVHAIEAGGKNRIPEMLADYIGNRIGFDVNDNIVQTSNVQRTGTDTWYRLAFRPSFDGIVMADRKYILVDDVFSNGGSFNELRLFIERKGGKVVQTAAMSLGGHGDKIAPEPEVLKALLDKYSPNSLSSFLREINLYEGNYKALTNPEAFALRRAPSLDEARDRILAARQAGGALMGAENLQKNEPESPQIKP